MPISRRNLLHGIAAAGAAVAARKSCEWPPRHTSAPIKNCSFRTRLILTLGNYAEANGVSVVRVPLTRTQEHDTDAMLAKADSATALVYICNPNNPTGTLPPRKKPGISHQ